MRVTFLLPTVNGNISKEIPDYPLHISSDHTFVITDIFPNTTKAQFEDDFEKELLEKYLYLKVSKITHMMDNKGYYLLVTLDFENKEEELSIV